MSLPENTIAAILMPEITNPERFAIRYSGLEHQLGVLGVMAAFAESHSSYNPSTHSFDRLFSSNQEDIYGVSPQTVKVIRDLTFPKSFAQPLYEDAGAPALVHNQDFNKLLAR